MNAKKQRQKNRRRANKLAQEAWQAVDDDRFDLAAKMIRRAVELNPASPLLWHDQGTLLVRLHDDDNAAQAFQAAIQLAPEFAEAYADLAAIRARQGKLPQAVTLQREAVRHAPQTERHRDSLATYELLLAVEGDSGPRPSPETQTAVAEDQVEHSLVDSWPDLAAAVEHLSWPELVDQLTGHGLAHVPKLLSAAQCESLRTMFGEDRRFAKTVTMNKSLFGRGVYRYFAAPLPPLVDAIRQLLYPHLAEIANRWHRLLHREQQYPPTWPAFQSRCAGAGQTTPSPLMLRYEAGGFNALHQDIRGDVFFPIQLVVVLSQRAETATGDAAKFTGGEFLFCDQPECKRSDRRAVPAGLGDAVLFCTRARLVRVGGAYGLKPVKHGLNEITSGTRYAIGIPFHEFT